MIDTPTLLFYGLDAAIFLAVVAWLWTKRTVERITVSVKPDGRGGWEATDSEWPGLVVHAHSEIEARHMLDVAIAVERKKIRAKSPRRQTR